MVMKAPIKPPSTGERKTKRAVLPIPFHSKALHPPLANPAPMRLNVRAWEELVGSPKYQVKRFQPIAENSVAAITALSTTSGLTRPLPIVPATFRWKTAKATKLKNAAHTTALHGL